MFKIKKNEIEGFKVEEYLKVFPETATQYLDWKVQQLWFYTVYPEGAIITEEPQPDPFKTPDTWVATTKVYLTRADRMDNLPAVQRSAKRGPKDNSETEETLDTYTLSIIASIASALTALGFGPALLTNSEKEALSAQLLGVPAPTDPTSAPVTENVAPVVPSATPVKETPEVKTEQPAPRRGRPTNAEKAAKEAAKAAESVITTEPAPAATTPVEEAVTTAPVAEEPIANVSGFASLDEARAVVCTYRNFAGITMGQIWDEKGTNARYQSFIDWCKSSDRAPEKCPNETAALKYLEANA